jgi:hypothetical protein
LTRHKKSTINEKKRTLSGFRRVRRRRSWTQKFDIFSAFRFNEAFVSQNSREESINREGKKTKEEKVEKGEKEEEEEAGKKTRRMCFSVSLSYAHAFLNSFR